MENVQNKTAIVTGGGSGIGYCIIEELLRNGAKRVAVIDLPIPRTHEALNKLQAEFGKQRVILFECDITKPEYEETFKKAVNALGGLDILVNNAGIGDETNVERMFAVNNVALIRGSLYGLNYMSKHKGGKGGTIVNIASVAGLRQFSFIPVYAATKHAVVGFSQALKDYYDKTEVRVLTMCPDMTKTSIAETVTFLEFVDMGNMWQDAFMVGQSPTNVACAVVELIQKGKNGAIWSVKVGERPHAHEFQPVTSVPV
ncbi:15-hydroxyprostaglandin dehydrogenase [NAD(+)]-like [Ooceraea biroi]|uniref:15-hydroxyprostaglandin dehydrogenase [NAD(+)]-like n=1 Tax=Ooceraea biroi TaxID=2015173 RepID=UPI0005BDFD57|nr:15-hydroxyprostaglandin dehydrogenase [NAD(+)]-like [Ooceraea biroi]